MWGPPCLRRSPVAQIPCWPYSLFCLLPRPPHHTMFLANARNERRVADMTKSQIACLGIDRYAISHVGGRLQGVTMPLSTFCGRPDQVVR